MHQIRTNWLRVLHSHFVLCTFVGLMVVGFLREPEGTTRAAPEDMTVLDFLLASAFTGGLVAAATWLLHRLVLAPILGRYFRDEDSRAWSREGTLTGFICGALGPLFGLAPFLIPLLAVLFLLLTLSYVRLFLRRVAVILRPGNYPQPADVARLVFLYGTLVAGFTLLNYAIVRLHPPGAAYRGLEQPIPDLFDLLYFSVVVMTTLGFGDISPISADAKLAVVMQVAVSYLLFALLIGTITRGILPADDADGDSGTGDG